MKKTVIWLDNYLEEFFMVISLILMTVIMGIQVFPDMYSAQRRPGRRRLPVTCLYGRDF